MNVERSVRLVNKLGLHVRPSAKIVETVSKYNSEVTITNGSQQANAKSIIELLTLAASYDSLVVIKAEGPDADKVANEIEHVIKSKFGEE
jgi:phosphotransferase system HPr (HPr) family protein